MADDIAESIYTVVESWNLADGPEELARIRAQLHAGETRNVECTCNCHQHETKE